MPAINKKNGSKYLSVNQLIDGFYKSRYNRDNFYDLAEGEDIDNSYKHRLYNKGDVKELVALLIQYFEDAIIKQNISRVYISDDIMLIRDSILPRIKYATDVDVRCLGSDKCESGKFYITDGNYAWSMWLSGDTYKAMQALRDTDQEFIKIKKDLKPVLEEKNKNAESKN